jgi:phosphoribosylpyrophosphate synthetase
MIIFGQFGDTYAESLAKSYKDLGVEPQLSTYCLTVFPGGEYKIRIVDNHCGRDSSKCDNSCKNPDSVSNALNRGETAVFVVRGAYGEAWNSDRLLGIARQGIELLKSGDREYFDGRKAERLCLLIPHETNTKQDHLFTKNDVPIRAEPKVLKMNRRTLRRDGADLLVTVLPHDYRREGWVRKKAYVGQEHNVLTDWKGKPTEGLYYLEDWHGFVRAIDPTDSIVSYIKRSGMKPDTVISPDMSAEGLALEVRRGLGSWGEALDGHRSRDNASDVTVEMKVDPKNVTGKRIAIVDDWVLRGGKSKAAIGALKGCNPARIDLIACHGECVGNTYRELADLLGGEDHLHFTDTVANDRAVISTIGQVAETMKGMLDIV